MVISIIFAGCAKPAPAPAPEAQGWGPMAGVAVKPDGSPYTAAMVALFSYSDWAVCANEMSVSLVERAGGECTIYDPMNELEKQIAIMETLILEKPSFIILHPVESAGMVPMVEKAVAAGIPVFNLDHKVMTDAITAFSTHDQMDCGRVDAKYLVALADETGKEYHVYENWGQMGHEGSERRHEGFHEIIDPDPRFTVMESPDNQWAYEKAMEHVLEAFPAYPELNAEFSHNGMVSGVIEAFRTLGILYPIGDPNHIPVLGIDEFPATMDLIREGYCDGTAVHSPWEEIDAMVKQALLYVCCGQQIPAVVMFDSFLMTQENIDTVRFGAPLVWGDLMMEEPDWDQWPILDLPDKYGVPVPTVDMKQPGY